LHQKKAFLLFNAYLVGIIETAQVFDIDQKLPINFIKSLSSETSIFHLLKAITTNNE